MLAFNVPINNLPAGKTTKTESLVRKIRELSLKLNHWSTHNLVPQILKAF